jgi:tetratricopeptide (TPR) repeat protein
MVDDSPMAVALAHQRAGRLAEAEEACRAILAERPGDAGAWHLLGLIAHQRGRHRQAADCLTLALAGNPRNSEALAHLGLVEEALGDHRRAVALLREAIALDPGNAEAHTNLGILTLASGSPEESIAALVRAAALDSDSVDCRLRLGFAYRRVGRPDEAAMVAEQAVAMAPQHARAHDLLALLRRDGGRLDEAIALHQRAMALDPNYAGGWNNAGNTLIEARRPMEAIAHLERALALQPDFAEAWLNLARAFLAVGKAGEALSAANHHLELAGPTLEGLCLSGDAARATGDVDSAIATYEKAIDRALDDGGAALGRLADACLAAGRWENLAELQAEAVALVERHAGQRLPPFLFMRLCGDPALQLRAAIDFSARRQRAPLAARYPTGPGHGSGCAWATSRRIFATTPSPSFWSRLSNATTAAESPCTDIRSGRTTAARCADGSPAPSIRSSTFRQRPATKRRAGSITTVSTFLST